MNRREQERKELSKYPCPEIDDFQTYGGVLLSDEITHYALKHKMIDPFNVDNLKPASYNVTVGDEYSIGGELRGLHDELGKNEIVIPSFQVVVIKTGERFNLPRFMIARWNIGVAWAYKGLIWVGGPQVDPGWVGYLHCPLYNLSNKPVIIRKGEAVATIDFVKTTPFKRERKNNRLNQPVEYTRPSKHLLLEEYRVEELGSGLYGEVIRIRNDVEAAETKVNRFGTRLDWATGIFMAIFAVFLTAFAVFIDSPHQITYEVDEKIVTANVSLPWWTYLSLGLSSVAFLSMCVVFYILLKHRK